MKVNNLELKSWVKGEIVLGISDVLSLTLVNSECSSYCDVLWAYAISEFMFIISSSEYSSHFCLTSEMETGFEWG